jgi:hypothetical protein
MSNHSVLSDSTTYVSILIMCGQQAAFLTLIRVIKWLNDTGEISPRKIFLYVFKQTTV